MKPILFLTATICLSAWVEGPALFGQDFSNPVGFVKFESPANTDMRISAPVHRPSVYRGNVTSLSGNVLTLASANFTAGQLIYNGTSQLDHFYVRVASGTAAGAWYSITGHTSDTLTVSPATTLTLSAQGLAATSGIDEILIIPHWTLKTIFPDQAGIVTSPDPFAPSGTFAMMIAPSLTGNDLIPTEVYIYHDGSSGLLDAGWYDVADTSLGTFDNSPLSPDDHLIMRNQSSFMQTHYISGDVPTTKITTNLLRLATTTNDNHVIQPFPIPLTVEQLSLVENAIFKPSPNLFAPLGDLLLKFPSPPTGIDLAPTRSYMYYDGSMGILPEGWYDIGNLFGGAVGSTLTLEPGEVFVIRRPDGIAQLDPWTLDLPYPVP
jgi:uncharacterized protein (TIGR02597 family)